MKHTTEIARNLEKTEEDGGARGGDVARGQPAISGVESSTVGGHPSDS